MKKFLIIPGLPRCATTSFTQILGQHPEIFLPKIKESLYFLPHKNKYYMFNRKGEKVPFDKSGFINTKKEFNANYNGFKDDCIYIDGSTLYASHHDSINEIHKQKDIDPYFIILKRDPFKRAVSHYLYSVSRGEEFRKFDEALNDEKNGLHQNWLLKGYLAGSDSSECEDKIKELWGESRLITVNIDTDNVFSQSFMNQVLANLNLDNFLFDFQETANTLTYATNPVMREIRIIFKRVRQLNPALFDNKFTRVFFNAFMKSIASDKDIYKQYMQYESLYYELFNNRVSA